jgi:hypothetical protein
MKTFILIAISLLIVHRARAQTGNAKEPYRKVYTNALTKKTTINFFDTDRHSIVDSTKYNYQSNNIK